MKETVDAPGYMKVRASVHHQQHEESDRPAQSRTHLHCMWPEGGLWESGRETRTSQSALPVIRKTHTDTAVNPPESLNEEVGVTMETFIQCQVECQLENHFGKLFSRAYQS